MRDNTFDSNISQRGEGEGENDCQITAGQECRSTSQGSSLMSKSTMLTMWKAVLLLSQIADSMNIYI